MAKEQNDPTQYGKELHSQWAQAFRSIGMWHISLHKCCQILAIIYDNGGNEAFTLNQRFVTDWKTAQDRLLIYGGTEIPADRMEEVAEGRKILQQYVKELEDSYDKDNPKSIKDRYPEWAKKVYEEYNLPMFG